jgi:uroporphyrinogen-III synthase
MSLPLAGRRVLDGKRILVTRAAHQAAQLSDGLRALGAEPVEVPVLEIGPPSDLARLDKALGALGSYDWLIVTSANAVKALEERGTALEIAFGSSAPKQVAAVGGATATAAHNAGLPVTLIPEHYLAESLVESLRGKAEGQRILLARAAVARDVIPDALRAAGATVDVVDAYRNVMPESAPAELRAALEKGIDAATFTSSSSVTHLADAARAAEVSFPFAGVAAISIGPITSQTLREAGWEPAAEANPHDVAGLVAALVKSFTHS